MDIFIIFDIDNKKFNSMRVNSFLLGLLTLYMSLSIAGEVYGQDGFSERDIVLDAFNKSNTTLIRSYMGNYISLHITDQTGVYTTQEAVTILSEFFKDHPPKSVTFVKEGESNLNYFCIASYISSGINWRVYLLFYKSNSKYIIKQIDIEKE